MTIGAEEQPMYCSDCGTDLDGAKFCPNCGKPAARARPRRVLALLVGAGVALLVVGAVLAVALLSGSSKETSGRATTPATSTRLSATVPEAEATALAQRYAQAWSAKSIEQMGDLLSPGYVRQEGGNPLQTRSRALAAYRREFATLTSPRYELSGLAITTGPSVATVRANYKISSAAGTTVGRIDFEMQRTGGALLITRSDVTPGRHTPAPASADDGVTTTTPSTTTQSADTCTVKAWYSNYTSAKYGYIHFKCVDDRSGTTVAEALGSDSFNFEEEQAAAKRTAKREDLLSQLKGKLESSGWHETGTASGGEWYQLQFGR